MFDTQSLNPKRLFLARHGESEANVQKIISGQLDVPLTEKGRKQAQWLCDVLKKERLSAVYSSSLGRAIETAKPTAECHHLPVQAIDNLKEIHFGVLQGRVADETDIEAKTLLKAREADKDYMVPGGESFDAFQARILHCLQILLPAMPDHSLLVAHRNTNEVILTNLLGLNQKSDRTINVKNKYLYEIQLDTTLTINTIRLGGEFHGRKFAGLKDD